MAKSMNVGAAMMSAYTSPAGNSVAKEKPSKVKPKSGGTSRVEIELADNGGFVVRCFYRQNNSTKGPSPYREPSTHAFEDPNPMMKFVVGALKGKA